MKDAKLFVYFWVVFDASGETPVVIDQSRGSDMKKHNYYAVIGLRALKRAAAKVAEDARKNNYKIPVWKNGRIEYVIPGVDTRPEDATDQGNTRWPFTLFLKRNGYHFFTFYLSFKTVITSALRRTISFRLSI